MTQSETHDHYVPDAKIVADHNDQFRRRKCLGAKTTVQLQGLIVMTHALAAMDPLFVHQARITIGRLHVFEADNDPDGFHDFGSVEIDGQKVWFKVDMYETGSGKRYGAERPDNPVMTERVMTLMLPSDWRCRAPNWGSDD